MKHAQLLVFSIIVVSFCLFSEIKSHRNILSKAALTSNSDNCTNKCNECQRIVYSLKFKQPFDCRSFQCESMCENIYTQWAMTTFNPFDNFQRDVFGKCEICFRQGHCSIMECQNQQKNELEVIEAIVNNSPLRSQNSAAEVQAKTGEIKIEVGKINSGINTSLAETLMTAIKVGSTAPVAAQINNLMTNYVLNPNPAVFLHPYSILNVNPLYVVPAGSLNYWNTLTGTELYPGVAQVEEVAKEIEANISKINEVKSEEKGNRKANSKVSAALGVEKDSLKRVEREIDLVEDSMQAATAKIEGLLGNPQVVDQGTKSALNDSLTKINSNGAELDKVRQEVEQSMNTI